MHKNGIVLAVCFPKGDGQMEQRISFVTQSPIQSPMPLAPFLFLQVAFKFGEAEIQVTALDEQSGAKVQTAIQFVAGV